MFLRLKSSGSRASKRERTTVIIPIRRSKRLDDQREQAGTGAAEGADG